MVGDALEDVELGRPRWKVRLSPVTLRARELGRRWRVARHANRADLRRWLKWAPVLQAIAADQSLDSGRDWTWEAPRGAVPQAWALGDGDCDSADTAGDGVPWLRGEPMPQRWRPADGCGPLCPHCGEAAMCISRGEFWLHPQCAHAAYWAPLTRANFDAGQEFRRIWAAGGLDAANAWAWARLSGRST